MSNESFCQKIKFFNSLQPDGVNLLSKRSQSLKYQRPKTSACKDIGIRKLKCVSKFQFLCLVYRIINTF